MKFLVAFCAAQVLSSGVSLTHGLTVRLRELFSQRVQATPSESTKIRQLGRCLSTVLLEYFFRLFVDDPSWQNNSFPTRSCFLLTFRYTPLGWLTLSLGPFIFELAAVARKGYSTAWRRSRGGGHLHKVVCKLSLDQASARLGKNSGQLVIDRTTLQGKSAELKLQSSSDVLSNAALVAGNVSL